MIVWFILTVGCQKSDDSVIQITCIPLFHERQLEAIPFADMIQEILKTSLGKSCHVQLYDRVFDAVDADSTFDKNYFLKLTSRLKFNYVVLCIPDSGEELVNIQMHYLNHGRSGLLLNEIFEINADFDSSLVQTAVRMIDLTGNVSEKSPNSICVINDPGYKQARYDELSGYYTCAGAYYKTHNSANQDSSRFRMKYIAMLLKSYENDKNHLPDTDLRLIEAEALLRPFIRQTPGRADAWLLMARVFLYKSRWNFAEHAFMKSYYIDSDHPDLYYYMSRLHPSRYHIPGMKNQTAMLKKAIELHHGYLSAYLALADLYYYSGRIEDAEMVYHQLLSIYPSSTDGLMSLAKLYLLRQKIPAMIALYDQIYRQDSHNSDILYNLGVSYYHAEKVDKAITLFKQAIVLDDYPDAHFYLARIYFEKKLYNQAASEFRQRIRLRTSLDDPYADEAAEQIELIINMKNSRTQTDIS